MRLGDIKRDAFGLQNNGESLEGFEQLGKGDFTPQLVKFSHNRAKVMESYLCSE